MPGQSDIAVSCLLCDLMPRPCSHYDVAGTPTYRPFEVNARSFVLALYIFFRDRLARGVWRDATLVYIAYYANGVGNDGRSCNVLYNQVNNVQCNVCLNRRVWSWIPTLV